MALVHRQRQEVVEGELDWQGLYHFPNDKVNSITIKAQG
jgi:hypothetical protein